MTASMLPAVLGSVCAATIAVADGGAGPALAPPVPDGNGTLTTAVFAGLDSFAPGMGLRVAGGKAGRTLRVDAGVTLRFAHGVLHVASASADPGGSAPGSVVRGSVELAVSRAHGPVRPWASVGFTRVGAQVDGHEIALCHGAFCPSLETEGPSGSDHGLELAAGVHVAATPFILLGAELRWTAVDTVLLEGVAPVEVGGPFVGVALTARL